MTVSWFELASAAFTGGIVVKLLDIIYSEYKRRTAKSSSAKELVSRHMDPILKSADELLGKLLSLAKEDFQPLYENDSKGLTVRSGEVQVGYVVYLFAHFWSRLAILRRESVSEHLVSQKEGRTLLQFIATLEARRNRIVNRALQRGIGDSIVEEREGSLRSKTFYNFFEEYSKPDSSIRQWVEPLRMILIGTSQKAMRQKVLFYGAIVHVFVDTLDSEHKYIRDRVSYPNKLNEAKRRDLRYRIFGEYLPMVRNSEKYWLIPRKDT